MHVDHIELIVPDRDEAAAWYSRVLGFEVVRAYGAWAADPQGPLMVSGDHGATMLALFQGAVPRSDEPGSPYRLAFRVGAEEFSRFLARARKLSRDELPELGIDGRSLVDHELALSVYFVDPYGHRLELTTYEHGLARNLLGNDGRGDVRPGGSPVDPQPGT